MPLKPTEQEEEYFARLEFERRRKVLEERESRAAEEERQRILAVARGRCPKCGAELVHRAPLHRQPVLRRRGAASVQHPPFD